VIRILYDNVADRVSSLTANTTAGTLAAANLQTDRKGEVHRTTGTTAVYTLVWTAAQTLNMAALAFTNLTAAATIKAQVYTLDTDPSPVLDTGAQLACNYAPYVPLGGSLGVNNFPYGAFVYARSYFASTPGKKLVITVSDAGNAAGYIECARLIAGAYWTPTKYAVGYGHDLAPKSNTQSARNEAGDLRAERRPVGRSVKLDLTRITVAADRSRIYQILRGNGMAIPVFLSLFPEDADAALENEHQVWGRLSDSAISHPSYGLYSAPLEIEEI
jgi:hypothetical protein